MMDVVFLSRLQFGIAACFHFLFVPLTLGLSLLLAIMETRYAQTGDEDYRRMARFWGKLFVINFVVGVVTGLTLEFQFGTNWSRYSAYVGDIFGSLLAIEASVAFFLESTFMGVWIFGWTRLSPKAHATVMWLVAVASNFSAVWIIIANAWMQHPVGYAIRNGRAELTDFMAVVTQPFAWHTLLHTLSGAYVLAAFFVMGVSAYHLLRKYETTLFTKSFRLALTAGLIFAIVAVVHGHYNGGEVAKTQPTKLAAMESHWETEKGAPIYLLAIPDEKNSRNALQILPIPGALSMLAYHSPSAEVTGLNAWPKEERPPVALTFISFRLMVGLGMLFMGLTIFGWFIRHRLMDYGWFLKIILYAIPLPYIALQAGWVVAEVGRQPWIVYGVMKTAAAASPLAVSQVAVSLVGFIAIYTLLSIVAFWLLLKAARKGPETAPAITL
ncbi:MAG: cytochrome ubiquinol oxidase subunit I [Deltaproteobacteria bacterium]|nr:cytochrome ubiquinol oxidase subunit I [Deltaproteobacteria bacterium]